MRVLDLGLGFGGVGVVFLLFRWWWDVRMGWRGEMAGVVALWSIDYKLG